MPKWIQKAIKRPGALRKALGVKAGEVIPLGKMAKIGRKLAKKAKEGKLPKKGLRELRQINLAKTLRKFKK